MTGANWHRALAYALVGEELPLAPIDSPDVAVLRDGMTKLGWPSERVVEHAHHAQRERTWPHRVPDELRAGLSAAQLRAALTAARASYGLDVFDIRRPSRRIALTADERRLIQDVPPHY